MPSRSAKKLDVPLPLRISTPHHEEAKHAARKMRKEVQDVIRETSEIGLKFLRLIDYDLAGAIIEKALRKVAEKGKEGGA